MKQFKGTLSLLVIMLLVFSSVGTAVTLDRSILPADTHWVMHLDMNQFNKTWLKKHLFDGEHDIFKLKRAEEHLSRYAKVDFFEDITGITVLGNKNNKHDMVVVCTGRFDQPYLLEQVRKTHDYNKEKYKKYTLHTWEHHNYGVFVGKSKLVYSRSKEAVKNVLDLMSGKRAGTNPRLAKYLEMIPANTFLSAAVEDISKLSGKRGYPSVMLKQAGMASFIALEKNKDLTMKVVLNTKKDETATQIQQMITGIIAVVRMQEDKEELKYARKLLDALVVKTEGNQVKLFFTFPSEELVKIISKSKGHRRRHRYGKD